MLTLTKSAETALRDWLSNLDIDPVVTVARERGDNVGWALAVCRRETLPGADLFTINGIVFYIDELWKSELDSMTIDFKNGRFSISTPGPTPAS